VLPALCRDSWGPLGDRAEPALMGDEVVSAIVELEFDGKFDASSPR
jgi:hypothetical protein